MGRRPKALLVMVFFGVVTGCDRSDAVPLSGSDPAATATESPSAEGGVDATASATLPFVPSARVMPAPTDGGPTASEAPLLFWMQGNVAAAVRQGDLVRLAALLEELATFAPSDPAYASWASIAKDGADAARAGSFDGAKAACRSCHAQYRNSYKSSLRARRLH